MATIEIGPHKFERQPGSERCRHCPASQAHPVHSAVHPYDQDAGPGTRCRECGFDRRNPIHDSAAVPSIGTAELGETEPDQADLADQAARRESPAGQGPQG